MIKRPERFITLLSVFLLLALAAGALNFHAHPEGRGKNCTLCQAPHVRGSLATQAALSRPLACSERPVFGDASAVTDIFATSVRSRGPPAVPSAV